MSTSTASCHLPGDSSYAEAVAGFQTGVRCTPEMVASPRDTPEVQEAIRYAAARGLRVVPRLTGHGANRPIDAGLMVSTRHLDTVRIDPARRLADIGAGVRWGRLIEAAASHGLAALNGSSPGVGVIGYTLGGGLGPLGRALGYCADHVRSMEVVTADGDACVLTEDEGGDLFWALRGSPDGLAIVTRMVLRLFPIEWLYGGSLAFDLAKTPELIAAYLELTDRAPETFTSSLSIVPFPDQPPFPEHLRGRHIATLHVTHLGAASDADTVLDPLRRLGPITDTVARLPYTQTSQIFNDPDQPHAYQGDAIALTDLCPATLDDLVRACGPGSPVMTIMQLNHLGGALARRPSTPNAVPHRHARFALRVLTPTDGHEPSVISETQAMALRPFADQTLGHLRNFVFGQRLPRLGDCFDRDTAARLTAAAERFDPSGCFASPVG